MSHTSETLDAPRAAGWRLRAAGLLRSHLFLLTLLAGQFALAQLLTGVQYGDAPRNLHWGLLTAERPGFLLGEPDTYERIKGFPPEPESLAPRGLYRGGQGGLHPWWGPVAPLLFALVWRLSGSYTLLQLVAPLAGGGAVLLTYALARGLLGAQPALLAAAFLACFPLYRDYATVSYTEAISALALAAALLAYLRGRTAATVLLGALAALAKMDILLLYIGTVGICLLDVLRRRSILRAPGAGLRPPRGLPALRHHVLALVGPALLASPWVWAHYLRGGAGGPTRGLSAGLFGLIAPQMLELLFYIPWYGALITLAAIGWCAAVGARALLRGETAHAQGAGAAASAGVLLCAWLGLGLLVLLVYAATPGAGNSPRVIIPALPALAVLFAAGFRQLGTAWRRRVGFYLVALFALINAVTIGYYALEGATLRSYAPVWAALRALPRGYVLTERYWPAILYARQPATWFEADESFERNIMRDAGNFARYVGRHPIRYVVLPAEGDALASDEVRAYVRAHAREIAAGRYTIYVLQPGE
ncbi:MAG TPA: glycosyltransferase family 39 protein [Roseiflexaceae bacterium]|nr:glycosyltransferase family 39 protein [Roseiflexaceae bacterium]